MKRIVDIGLTVMACPECGKESVFMASKVKAMDGFAKFGCAHALLVLAATFCRGKKVMDRSEALLRYWRVLEKRRRPSPSNTNT